MKSRHNTPQAFTIIELLVVIAVIAVLVLIQIPALAASKAGVQRIYCSNNLKQIGIAFRTWAGKNGGRMPMALSYTQGGSAEAVGVRGNNFNFSSIAKLFGCFSGGNSALILYLFIKCFCFDANFNICLFVLI